MNAGTAEAPEVPVVYPESDGKPMADNTKQARWIMVFHGNLEALLRDVEAFVAANLMWYAKEGFPEDSAAPDVFVAFGRPRGERRSYLQWQEEEVAPQIVFEILSEGNTGAEMDDKEAFYADHGVEEYYVYDPDKDYLSVYLRKGTVLRRKWIRHEFTSPRLGINFDLTGKEMQVFYPDGRRFLTFVELEADRSKQAQLRLAAEQKLQTAEQKLQTAEQKLQTAEQKLQTAEQRWQRLSELSRKARRGQAGPEELAELERLENESNSRSS